MAYADITTNDPNPIKRWLQRNRFVEAISLLPKEISPTCILDFGGGDGELSLHLKEYRPVAQVICYEPSEEIFNEAHEKISKSKYKNHIQLLDNIKNIKPETVDVVYSLEVFEHLPKEETEKAIQEIHAMLKPDGLVIIGVPNEIYLAALYKGIFRTIKRYGEFDTVPLNVLKCILGRPPKNRPIGELSKNVQYHFHHVGFDCRKLPSVFSTRFKLLSKRTSPFQHLGYLLTPEVYFVFKKT